MASPLYGRGFRGGRFNFKSGKTDAIKITMQHTIIR